MQQVAEAETSRHQAGRDARYSRSLLSAPEISIENEMQLQ